MKTQAGDSEVVCKIRDMEYEWGQKNNTDFLNNF